MRRALPTLDIRIDGVVRKCMLDSGCTTCIAHKDAVMMWRKESVWVETACGRCVMGIGRGTMMVHDERSTVKVDVIVTSEKPLGFDCIIGNNAIIALGGVRIDKDMNVSFSGISEMFCCVNTGGNGNQVNEDEVVISKVEEMKKPDQKVKKPPRVESFSREASSDTPAKESEKADFQVRFDRDNNCWVASWKWAAGYEPEPLLNKVREYRIPKEAEQEYDREVSKWIQNGWLVPYCEEKYGKPKGLIPLMAVIQKNKEKVRPCLDFRELNSHVDVYSGSADVCSDKLRQWRRLGSSIAVCDLRDAYLQVRIDEKLWPYQTVIYRNQRLCLTRLGFGVNVGPLIMSHIVNQVLSYDPQIQKATSAFVDDIICNEEMVSASDVVLHLKKYGLECKDPERVSKAGGMRVLGLRVWRDDKDETKWRRDNDVITPSGALTKRKIFSFCGQVIGHHPVCDWLRPACAFLKRKANSVSSSWDESIVDNQILQMVDEISSRLKEHDPVKGNWKVTGHEATLWVDSSSIALGASIEVAGQIIEDGSWIISATDEPLHINLMELNAVVRGINMALAWDMKVLHIKTDSLSVFHWIQNVLTDRRKVRTKALSELLVRRRLTLIKSLVSEYELTVDIELVPSALNKSDRLTRVPKKWLKPESIVSETEIPDVVAATSELSPTHVNEVEKVHEKSGHPGIRRTLYFCKRAHVAASKATVKQVIERCQVCAAIDPAPVQWEHGTLSVEKNWTRVAIDITHYRNSHFLSLICCGPSRYCIWRELRTQGSVEVVKHLNSIFLERSAPFEILIDNATAFRGKIFTEFAKKWAIKVTYRCVNVASGNGIVERCHRSVKRIAARKNCDISEAVFLYNVSPLDDCNAETAPVNHLFAYDARVKDIDPPPDPAPTDFNSAYSPGDLVWVSRSPNKCDVPYKRGVVTRVLSPQAVEVDGLPQHIRNVRPRLENVASIPETAVTEEPLILAFDGGVEEAPEMDVEPHGPVGNPEENRQQAPDVNPEQVMNTEENRQPANEPRRSVREHRLPRKYCCDFEIRGECTH